MILELNHAIGRDALKAELTRLAVEAVARLEAGDLLAAIATVYAIPPVATNLLGHLTNELESQVLKETDDSANPGGIYL